VDAAFPPFALLFLPALRYQFLEPLPGSLLEDPMRAIARQGIPLTYKLFALVPI
jgi:hypothetical protein